jgi:hypothetical protein
MTPDRGLPRPPFALAVQLRGQRFRESLDHLVLSDLCLCAEVLDERHCDKFLRHIVAVYEEAFGCRKYPAHEIVVTCTLGRDGEAGQIGHEQMQ